MGKYQNWLELSEVLESSVTSMILASVIGAIIKVAKHSQNSAEPHSNPKSSWERYKNLQIPLRCL